MKFELKPDNRNATDKDVLDDVIRVANVLNKKSLIQKEYKEHGRFSYSTVTRRLGSWINVMALAGLEISNYHKIEDAELLEDLKKVANALNKKSLTESEYRTLGKYSTDPFYRFGSWNFALEKAGLEKSRNNNISTDELFENLEEIWTRLGRQPYYGEIEKPSSKYSRDVYSRRFGSWRKALEAFVKYVNEDEPEQVSKKKPSISIDSEVKILIRKTKRNINWRLRFIVMKRDDFKCKSCGRSPATDPSIILHVDHIKPWSQGGETKLDNLQTLCSVCNIGKSNI